MLGSTATLTSCGGDDDDDLNTNTNNSSNTNNDNNSNSGNSNVYLGEGTWYATQSDINSIKLNKVTFEEIEKAIDKNEKLDSTIIPGRNYYYIYHYASKNNFVYGDGSFSTQGGQLGRLRNTINVSFNTIRIVDSNTLAKCHFCLFVDEDMTYTNYVKVATVFNGHIFKSVSLYYYESYYTYFKQDNKMIDSNGTVYTVANSGLIQEGTSSPMVAFDPAKAFGLK